MYNVEFSKDSRSLKEARVGFSRFVEEAVALKEWGNIKVEGIQQQARVDQCPSPGCCCRRDEDPESKLEVVDCRRTLKKATE